VKIGAAADAAAPQITLDGANSAVSAVLSNPPDPVSAICGKYAARATPICAFAATTACSACWMSGRRSISADGRPAGTSGRCG
jgi:hypothetical protein